MSTSRPLLLFNYRRNRAYSFHALMGALEKRELDRQTEVRFVRDRDALSEALAEAERDRRRVLVAWSFFSPNFAEAKAELDWIRDRHENPDVLHIAGGVHATALPRDTLEAGFERVATGDGERTFSDFVSAWIAGEEDRSLPGIYRLEEGRAVSGGAGERVNLDDWPPFAARDGWYNPIEITRGCIYACRFCQAPFAAKARFRHRSITNIVEAVRIMGGRKLKDIRFITPTALSYGTDGPEPDLDKVEELLDAVRAEIIPGGRLFFGSFPSEARPEHLDTASVSLLKRYVDNDNLVIGAQSGSDRVLKNCHRGHTVEDVVRGTHAALEAGFKTYVDFIFGLPGETAEDVKLSLDLAQDLADRGARIHAHAFLPLPGTPFAREAPAEMPEDVRLAIERLASRGALFGQWRAQAELAPSLAELTPEKRRAGTR